MSWLNHLAPPVLDVAARRRIMGADDSSADTLRAVRLIREAEESVRRRHAAMQEAA